MTMLEYENEKSETTFYPRTLKVFHIKVVLFFGLVNFFMLKLPLKNSDFEAVEPSGMQVKIHVVL